MHECREQGRDSTRRREGSGFDGPRLRVVDTAISLSAELACDPPARDGSRAPDCAGIVSRSIARWGRGHGTANQENPSAEGRAATTFHLPAGRTLKRYAIASLLFMAMLVVSGDNGLAANLVGSPKGSLGAPGIFSPFSGQSVSSDRKPVLLAQMSKNEYRPLIYFLDEPPSDLSQSTLPPSAGEIVVAKVRLMGRSSYLVGRDQSGRPPAEKPPEELFSAQLELLDVVRGKRPAEIVRATFGLADNTHTYIRHPTTPQQLARDYFVAIYEEGGRLHLAGFPSSEASYREWEKEFLEYERTRLMSPRKQ